jgi:pyruvate decarboxylase
MSSTQMTIGNYLLRRLKEFGVDIIFGVPGDYNLQFLDQIEDFEGIQWGNNCNELNASYAADGYARIRGIGAIVTTFGVGELSAINGIAGSYAEMVPVVHIVGTPPTASQASGAILHHTLGTGDYRVFANMYKEVTIAQTNLTKTNAVEEIDRVLTACLLKGRPVYIGLAVDLSDYEITVDPSSIKPLNLSIPQNPKNEHQAALETVLDLAQKAQNIVVIIDACAIRHDMMKSVLRFVERTQLAVYVTPMAKGSIDETHPQFRGVFAGNCSTEQVQKEVYNADLILSIGSMNSDFNTGGFSYRLSQKKTIEFHTYHTKVFYALYDKVDMRQLLPDLTEQWPSDIIHQYHGKPFEIEKPVLDPKYQNQITHEYFWHKLPDFIPENSIVVAETGTSEFGVFNMRAPKGVTFLSQILWGSIGYSVGAALGAALAGKDENRRVFLLVGDGSFQLVAQEVSTMLRFDTNLVILLLNNAGYTIEKLIHGPDRAYNNIQMWRYHKSFEYFGNGLEQTRGQAVTGFAGQVKTQEEFEKVMTEVVKETNKIHFVELIMPVMDAPKSLVVTIEGTREYNKRARQGQE